MDELLVPVASEAVVEDALLKLLQSSTESTHSALSNSSEFDELDARHHAKWTAAQANHIAENRQHVDHRIHSRTASHRARCKAIEDQINRATNDKIRMMKQGELARANADFERHMSELQRAASSGDIHATAVLFGTITVAKG